MPGDVTATAPAVGGSAPLGACSPGGRPVEPACTHPLHPGHSSAYHPPLLGGQTDHHRLQRGLHFPSPDRKPRIEGRRGRQRRRSTRLLCRLLHDPPQLAGNGHAGIGGKGRTPPRIIAQDGAPQTNAPLVHGFCVGQRTAPLFAHDIVHQPLVTVHEGRHRLHISSLCTAKQIRPFRGCCGSTRHGVSPFDCSVDTIQPMKAETPLLCHTKAARQDRWAASVSSLG
jgi:hypothetical protein